MFAPVVPRKGTWKAYRGNRPPRLTTCEQAEVLYPGGLDMVHLRRVYVRTGDEADRVEVVEDRAKFSGQP
jgi:hypothetical protein